MSTRRTQVNELSSVVELHPPVRTTGLKLGVPLTQQTLTLLTKEAKRKKNNTARVGRDQGQPNKSRSKIRRKLNGDGEEGESRVRGELWICKCLTAPHRSNEDEGATIDGAGLCVRVSDGGRGARRQSPGTEPGMPSLQAKQEHGEP